MPRQVAPLLLLGADPLDARRHDQVRVEDAGERHPHFRDALHDPGVGGRRQAEAAVVRRDGGAEQAERLHLLDHLVRIDVVVLERMHVRTHVALQPSADGVEDLVVIFGRVAQARRGAVVATMVAASSCVRFDYWACSRDASVAMISHSLQHRQGPSCFHLSGLRVIAVEQYGAGPFGSMLLGDLGAEVIKIENPAEGGDVGRRVGPHYFAPGDSQFFHAYNRNKRSLTLNLKHPEAHARPARTGALRRRHVRQPARRPARAARRDLRRAEGGQSAHRVRPSLGLWARGPRKAWPGYDYLMQAEAGYLALTGEPDGPPSRFGLSIVDQMTGLYAAFAIVSGVLSARADRQRPRHRRVAVRRRACRTSPIWRSGISIPASTTSARRARAIPSLTPSQLYRTRDGFIFIMCNKEKFWPVLCECIGRPEWSERPDYKDFAARLANRAQADRRARRGPLGAHDRGMDRRTSPAACRPRRCNDVAGGAR